MPHHEFIQILIDNIEIYIFSIVLSAIPIYYIAKLFTHTWLDPLRIALITVPLANAVPLFLFFMNQIPTDLFYYTLCAEVLFWIGFIIPAKRKILFSNTVIIEDVMILRVLFTLILTLYISFYSITYIKFGIPIFLESRLSTFFDSGGFGVLGRLNPFFELFILMYCYWQINIRSTLASKGIYFIPLLLIATTSVLSGSRSGMITFLTSYFGYIYYYVGIIPNDKIFLKYFPIILVGAISVLLITNQGDINSALLALLVRFMATGDCYYMAYPNDILNDIDIGNSTLFLLSNILAPLRIIDITLIAKPVGVQLTSILYPYLDGLFVGPNARPPILGYVLFGWMGFVFTFITGYMTSILLFRLPSIVPRGFVTMVVLFFIYIVAIRFITDPTYGIGSLFDIALNLLVLRFLISICYLICFKQPGLSIKRA